MEIWIMIKNKYRKSLSLCYGDNSRLIKRLGLVLEKYKGANQTEKVRQRITEYQSIYDYALNEIKQTVK